MIKKLSKVLSLFLIVAVLVSNLTVVSFAAVKDKYAGHETQVNKVVLSLREAMTKRKKDFNVKYKTNVLYDDLFFADFINGLFSQALEVTDKSDEGDYLSFNLADYGCGQTNIREEKGYYYYDIPFYMDYYTSNSQEKKVKEEVEKIIKGFKFDKNTTDKVKCDKIYRYITSHVSYDYDNLYDDSYNLKYTAYAALINGKSVCQGYANLFYMLAKECGLDVRIIAGESRNPDTNEYVGHAWNIVKLQGQYYFVDSTWDAGTNAYKYYLKGTDDFNNHLVYEDYATEEFQKAYPISQSNYGDIHNYKVVYEDEFLINYACEVCEHSYTDLKVSSGETLAKGKDGKWYYLVDGVKKKVSTLIEHDGELCYVKDGIWDQKAKNIVEFDGKHYYIKDGVWDQTYTKVAKSGSQYIYIKDGIWENKLTGLVEYNKKTYYFVDGKSPKGEKFVKLDGTYYYIKDGVNTDKTGFVKYNNEYRYVVDGVWVKDTCFAEYNGKTYYIKKGVRSSSTGFVELDGKSYYISKGVKTSKTGFVKHDKKYRYVVDGVWVKDTCFAEYKDKIYYVKKGIRSSSTGFVKVDNKYYEIEKGVKKSDDVFVKCKSNYIKLSTTEYTYNGKSKKPSVKAYDSKGNKISSKYYDVEYESGRKKVGKYKVTVTFKKKYSGEAELYFTIIPDNAKISKVSAEKSRLTVKIKSNPKQITGYELQYSTSKTFNDDNIVVAENNNLSSIKLKGLKAKKTYYVRIRSYKDIDGEKYYSEWSKTYKQKTK